MHVLAGTLGSVAAVSFAAAAVVVTFALIALLVGAIVSVARSEALTGAGKFAWIVGVLMFPFVGSLTWFVIGRKGAPRLYRSQTA